jgi:hypothetical protein
MSEKSFEGKDAGVRGAEKETNGNVVERGYGQYHALGGIINEKDYESALARAKQAATLENKQMIAQAESIASASGITLQNTKDALDPRTVLYGILRGDTKPEGVQYHHSQMSDQRLFAEALRMLGDADSLQKLISTYGNISF